MSELTLKERVDAAWRAFIVRHYLAKPTHGEKLVMARLFFGTNRAKLEQEAQLKRTDPVYTGRE